jgi:hypothetical protein
MLKTKQVGKYTCTQMGPLESIRLRAHAKNIDALKITDEELLAERNSWAFMAACVTPFISWEEYIQTPMAELKLIIDALNDLNEGFEDGPQTKKKSKGKPPKSTTG